MSGKNMETEKVITEPDAPLAEQVEQVGQTQNTSNLEKEQTEVVGTSDSKKDTEDPQEEEDSQPDETTYDEKDEVDQPPENQDPEQKVEKSSENTNTQTTDSAQSVESANPVETPQEENQVTVWSCIFNGERPYKGALSMYAEILDAALDKARENLEERESGITSVVLQLFSVVDVPCADQFGNKCTKKYTLHELHYGPVNKVPRFPTENDVSYYWRCFQSRDSTVFVDTNSDGKNPGGDGTGFGNTACSPFREKQIQLMNEEGLYLTDRSYVAFDSSKNKFFYKINIVLSTNPPREPFRSWNGYGFIPGLGPAHRPQNRYGRTRQGNNRQEGSNLSDTHQENEDSESQVRDVKQIGQSSRSYVQNDQGRGRGRGRGRGSNSRGRGNSRNRGNYSHGSYQSRAPRHTMSEYFENLPVASEKRRKGKKGSSDTNSSDSTESLPKVPQSDSTESLPSNESNEK